MLRIAWHGLLVFWVWMLEREKRRSESVVGLKLKYEFYIYSLLTRFHSSWNFLNGYNVGKNCLFPQKSTIISRTKMKKGWKKNIEEYWSIPGNVFLFL